MAVVLAEEAQVAAGKKSWARKVLTLQERLLLEKRIQALEEKTGAELVVVILRSADSYLSAPLLIASFFTFLTTLIISTLFSFSHEAYMLLCQIPLFFLFYFIGRLSFFKVLAVSDAKKNEEFNEKALTLFHELGVERTHGRVGSLLVISLFERKIRLLVDEALAQKINQTELDTFVQTLIPHFRKRKFYQGLNLSLELIEKKYEEVFTQKVENKPKDQLSNAIRWFDFS